MDLQSLFYLFGIIVFVIAIVVFVVVLVLTLSLYYRSRQFYLSSKEKLARFKRGLTALPVIPFVNFIIKKIKNRKR